MNLPYYQIDSEVFQTAADLAVLLDWDESRAFHGIAKAVKWMLARCPDDAPPSANAVVRGAAAAKLIARAAGWTGDAEAFVDACETISPPFLQRVVDGVRMRGLKRYDSTWGKSHPELWKAWKAKQESGPAPSDDDPGPDPDRNRDGTGPEPARKMKTETKTEMKNDRSPPPTPSAISEPTGFPQAAAGKTTWDLWQENRLARGLPIENALGEKFDDWLLKYEHQYGIERLDRCFEVYLDDPWSRARNPKGKLRNATVALFISDGVFASRVLETRGEFNTGPPLRLVRAEDKTSGAA